MPGLIESRRYTRSKAELCESQARLSELIDAIEWELLHATAFDYYPLVANTPRGPVRSYQITSASPGVLIVFGFEMVGDDEKVLLLDVRVPQVADDDEES